MASVLDKLIQNAKFLTSGGFGKGNWGTPEFGLTEQFAKGKTQSILDAQNRSGQVQGLSSDMSGSGGGGSWDSPAGAPSGGGTGTGGYRPTNGSSETDSLTGLADDSKASRIQAIKDRLGMIRDQVNRQIGVAKGVRDELVGNITNTYGGLKTSAQQKVGTALENLGQEKTGVYNTYGTAKGESRRALESALTKNRMLARAMNRLNSSFYDDRQAESTETGARNISGLAREEAGKVAGIGTRETEIKNWGEQTALQIEQEEASLKTQADREYQQKVDDAMAMEKAFGIDSEDELNQAEIEYQSKLGAISQYVQNKGLRIAEIMAQAGLTGAGIDSFSAYTPELQNLLGDKTLLNRAENTEIPTFSGAGGNTANYLSYFNQGNTTGTKLDQLLGNILYDPRLRNNLA